MDPNEAHLDALSEGFLDRQHQLAARRRLAWWQRTDEQHDEDEDEQEGEE